MAGESNAEERRREDPAVAAGRPGTGTRSLLHPRRTGDLKRCRAVADRAGRRGQSPAAEGPDGVRQRRGQLAGGQPDPVTILMDCLGGTKGPYRDEWSQCLIIDLGSEKA